MSQQPNGDRPGNGHAEASVESEASSMRTPRAPYSDQDIPAVVAGMKAAIVEHAAHVEALVESAKGEAHNAFLMAREARDAAIETKAHVVPAVNAALAEIKASSEQRTRLEARLDGADTERGELLAKIAKQDQKIAELEHADEDITGQVRAVRQSHADLVLAVAAEQSRWQRFVVLVTPAVDAARSAALKLAGAGALGAALKLGWDHGPGPIKSAILAVVHLFK